MGHTGSEPRGRKRILDYRACLTSSVIREGRGLALTKCLISLIIGISKPPYFFIVFGILSFLKSFLRLLIAPPVHWRRGGHTNMKPYTKCHQIPFKHTSMSGSNCLFSLPITRVWFPFPPPCRLSPSSAGLKNRLSTIILSRHGGGQCFNTKIEQNGSWRISEA